MTDLLLSPQAGDYQVVYADPAWKFRPRGKQGKGSRHADRHYQTMPLEEIKALPVREITAKDCWLFMWTSGPWIPPALEVMKAWGFTYSTRVFTWVKMKPNQADPLFMMESDFPMGTGYTSRAQTEIVLLGRRGKPKRIGTDVPELIFAPRRQHSRKPDETYDRIARLVGATQPRIEMFARQSAPGWDVWGNETTKFEMGEPGRPQPVGMPAAA